MKKFVCKRCGACCRWHGYVNLSEIEAQKIALFLKIPFDEFMDKFVILKADRRGISLTEQPDGSCIFFNEAGLCAIQEVKPGQCRAFPEKWNFPGYEKECKGEYE